MSTFSDETLVNHIALVMAMEAEALPLIEHLGLKQIEKLPSHGTSNIYQGEVSGGKLSVILPGKDAKLDVCNVGTVPGAIVCP